MNYLSIYDYIVIAFFMIFMLSVGFVIKRFLKGSKDYFAGGQRVCWWLLGGSVFVSSFSSWTFTGASGIAYKYGLLILFSSYIPYLCGVLFGYFYFAARLRQIRVITGAESVRIRFGKFNEQFFNWFGLSTAPLGPAVQLTSLGIIFSTVFGFDPLTIILVSGIVVIFFTVIGGSWAVMASDFIQLLLVLIICIVTAVLCIVKLGGVGNFIAQIPVEKFVIFHPLGSIKYDWLFLVGTIISITFFSNGITTSYRYLSARDGEHAKKSALIPIFCYIFMPLLFFVPPLACFTLVPDLMAQSKFQNPEEGAYILAALSVLPKGLIGLLVVGLFASTMSSINSSLNGAAASITWNFYRSIIRPKASDREYFIVGVISSVLFGILILLTAVFVHKSGVSLFDAYMYMYAFLGTGSGVVFVLGFFIKNTPKWAAWGTVIFNTILSFIVFSFVLGGNMQKVIYKMLHGQELLYNVYDYFVKVPFVVTTLIIIPLSILFFLSTTFFYKRGADPEMDKSVDKFFIDKETPVDFDKEVGHDNTAQQAGIIGAMASIYGVFILLMLLIPNDWIARLAILFCALVLLGIGLGLLWYRKVVLSKATLEHPQES